MLKRKYMFLVVFVLFVLVIAGCNNSAFAERFVTVNNDVDQTLIWNLGAVPQTIDPSLNTSIAGGHVINNTFEGLMREVGDHLELAMAESYTISEGGLTYTFNIRERAKWSDGKPVTAFDFEYAWDRVTNPAIEAEYAWIFDEGHVSSWSAIDDKTFKVKLTEPTPYFLGLTAFYTFFPVREDMLEIDEEGTWAITPATAVSNGPFKVTDYQINDKLTLEPNEFYWRSKEVKLDKLIVLMIEDLATSLTGYESGQIHVIDDLPSLEIQRILAEEPSSVVFPYDAVYYYSFNTRIEPMNDVRVRKALSISIDRQAIVETVTKAGQLPAHSLISGSQRDANGDLFNEISGTYGITPTAQVKEAQALLAEAGYPNGQGFPVLEIMYNTSEGHKNIANAIQEMWKETLNIEVTLVSEDWAIFQNERIEHNFQIARAGWIGDYSDPMTFLNMFKSDGRLNYSQWSNAEYDALLESSKVAQGQERFDILYQADKLLSESYAVMPIYYYTDLQMINKSVQGYEKTTRNLFYFGRTEMTSAVK